MTPTAAAAAAGLAAVALAALCPGCGLDLGEPTEWVDVATIEGALAAEHGAADEMPAVPAGSRRTLRVVTYNVNLGADPEGLAAQLRANPALAAADVLLLQEEEAFPAERASRTRRLATALGMGWSYVPGRMKGDGTHGLAILSRFPIEDAHVMTLPRTEAWKPRIAIRAEVVVGEARLPVVNVHLETRINITDRILQLRPAVLELPAAVIVGGDVNTNPFLWEEGEVPLVPLAQIADTEQAPLLDDYMRALGFTTPAAEVGATHRVHGVESRLDAIYTRGLAVTPAQVERTLTTSDHWPVWVDVTLP